MKKKGFKIQQMECVYASKVILLLLLSLLLLTIAPAYAQTGQELLAAIAQQMGRSMQALTGYSFQQRTDVQINGETKSVQVVQVAFGPDKRPLITPISSQPSGGTGVGLRGRIKEKEAEEMKKEVQNLVQMQFRLKMLRDLQLAGPLPASG